MFYILLLFIYRSYIWLLHIYDILSSDCFVKSTSVTFLVLLMCFRPSSVLSRGWVATESIVLSFSFHLATTCAVVCVACILFQIALFCIVLHAYWFVMIIIRILRLVERFSTSVAPQIFMTIIILTLQLILLAHNDFHSNHLSIQNYLYNVEKKKKTTKS